MTNRPWLRSACLLALVTSPVLAQGPMPWHDPSPHSVQFVRVQDDVRLEVLDWGGSGRPIVLLAGLGNTAHVFDEFAPKLRADGHVYGLTRRGYGASSVPAAGYDADRLGDDVIGVLDVLRLSRPVLVGHSIAAQELSSIGNRYPERVGGLVYLDGAYDSFEELEKKWPMPPMPRPLGPDDQRSVSALLSYFEYNRGYKPPEAELRQSRDVAPDGRVGPTRTLPWVAEAIIAGARRFVEIRSPALAIYAVPRDVGAWVGDDPSQHPSVEAFLADLTAAINQQAAAFEKSGAAGVQVVRLPQANHYVFISHEADILRELRRFLSSPP